MLLNIGRKAVKYKSTCCYLIFFRIKTAFIKKRPGVSGRLSAYEKTSYTFINLTFTLTAC